MTGHLPLRPSNLPALTGLRFLAAGAVFTFHYGASALATAGAPGPVVQLLRNGYLGVSLFFVLSGFILTYTHQHDVLSARYLRGFFVARFARLYPVYFLALMLALPAFPDQPHVLSITSVLLMVQAWTYPASSAGFYWVTQAWTLSVELFFFLCFPLILLASRRLQLATILALASVCAVLMVGAWPAVCRPGNALYSFYDANHFAHTRLTAG